MSSSERGGGVPDSQPQMGAGEGEWRDASAPALQQTWAAVHASPPNTTDAPTPPHCTPVCFVMSASHPHTNPAHPHTRPAGSSSPLPLATPASPASSRQMPSQYSQRSEGGSPRLLPRGDIASQGSRILAGAMSPARGGGASMPSTPASSAAGSRAQRRGSPRTDASANTPGGRRTPGSASEVSRRSVM